MSEQPRILDSGGQPIRKRRSWNKGRSSRKRYGLAIAAALAFAGGIAGNLNNLAELWKTASVQNSDKPSRTDSPALPTLVAAESTGPTKRADNGERPVADRLPLSKSTVYLQIRLLLPSYMKNADIFVDGNDATVIKQLQTIVVLRLERSEKVTSIEAKKGDLRCEKTQLFLQDGETISICQ